MRRALVTGATGFVGGAVSRALAAAGVEVVAVARNERPGPWQRFVAVDLAHGLAPSHATGCDAVFHVAGLAHAIDEVAPDEERYRRANVDSTRHALAAAAAAGAAAFVLFSSVKAMGEGGPERLDEGATPAPATAYGRSKLEAERVALAAPGGPAVCVLRLPLVYGPGARGNLDRMLRAVASGLFPPLPAGCNRRSMVHVEDVAAAALLAASAPAAGGRLYILTDGRAYSTREIHEMMCDALGRRPPRATVPLGALRALAGLGTVLGRVLGRRAPFDRDALDKLVGSAWYASARAEAELGFRARHTLADALPEMVAAMRGAGR